MERVLGGRERNWKFGRYCLGGNNTLIVSDDEHIRLNTKDTGYQVKCERDCVRKLSFQDDCAVVIRLVGLAAEGIEGGLRRSQDPVQRAFPQAWLIVRSLFQTAEQCPSQVGQGLSIE